MSLCWSHYCKNWVCTISTTLVSYSSTLEGREKVLIVSSPLRKQTHDFLTAVLLLLLWHLFSQTWSEILITFSTYIFSHTFTKNIIPFQFVFIKLFIMVKCIADNHASKLHIKTNWLVSLCEMSDNLILSKWIARKICNVVQTLSC